MKIEELPTGWWLPLGTWIIVETPVPKIQREFLGKIIRASTYVPVFSSERKAGDYIISHLLRADPIAFRVVSHFGMILEGLNVLGITHLAFDPDDTNEPELIPINAIADELHRRFLGAD